MKRTPELHAITSELHALVVVAAVPFVLWTDDPAGPVAWLILLAQAAWVRRCDLAKAGVR